MGKSEANQVQKITKKYFDKALLSQHELAIANVARLRRLHPDKTPTELVGYMNKWFLGAVAASGAGAGAAAAAPNLVVQIPAALADVGAFVELSVLYTLSVAIIHDLPLDDVERRSGLVAVVLLGKTASEKILGKAIERTAPYWGKALAKAVPLKAIKLANKLLGPYFVTRFGAVKGVIVLGEQAPFFVGAAVGGAGNSLFGMFIVKSARKILGPLPESWEMREAIQK